nr:PREDICTED: leucine-rich repeat-containing protein 24 isoform X1 [Anolis carolinensis]XP_008120231.1 PREDICTED: leucine-rich repeat-containing protein 24 isoform X1 [Anolis carolinensis]|eukprot:XP_008120230.1 PREDICTED: leucine-rich repeat-containing protein 24 isoform X1 [Anolis carolinensis]
MAPAPASRLSLFLLGLMAAQVRSCPSTCRCYSTTVECGSLGLKEIPGGIHPSTQTVFLQDNSVTQIHQQDLAPLWGLQYLYMQNNTISALEPGAFRNQNRLLELALNGNRIHLINSSIFKGLEHLRVLYLAGNQITRLPDFTFCDLERLPRAPLAGEQHRGAGGAGAGGPDLAGAAGPQQEQPAHHQPGGPAAPHQPPGAAPDREPLALRLLPALAQLLDQGGRPAPLGPLGQEDCLLGAAALGLPEPDRRLRQQPDLHPAGGASGAAGGHGPAGGRLAGLLPGLGIPAAAGHLAQAGALALRDRIPVRWLPFDGRHLRAERAQRGGTLRAVGHGERDAVPQQRDGVPRREVRVRGLQPGRHGEGLLPPHGQPLSAAAAATTAPAADVEGLPGLGGHQPGAPLRHGEHGLQRPQHGHPDSHRGGHLPAGAGGPPLGHHDLPQAPQAEEGQEGGEHPLRQ